MENGIPIHKLGKTPARKNDKTLYMADYLTPALPTIPESFSWIDLNKITAWGMYLNDQYGICVQAAEAHLIMARTAACGSLFVPPIQAVVDAYAGCTGFNPATGEGDNGTDELSWMGYMQKTGIAGHKTGAYLAVNPKNIQEVKTAIYLFGGQLLGVQLPLYVQGLSSWDAPADPNDPNAVPGSWGGHGICGLSYSDLGINIITWGKVLPVSWTFFTEFFDEAWADVSPDFVNGTKPAPNGFDMETLQNDLNAL